MHAKDKTGNTNPALQKLASRMKEMDVETKGMRKKKKRDDSKIWIDAEENFYRCAEHLQMAKFISGLLRHPELKQKLAPDQFNDVVSKAKGLAGTMKEMAVSLKSLRAQHLEIIKKYPARQKKHRGSAEMLDYLTVAESYMSWMEDAIGHISAPALEIIGVINEAGISISEEEDVKPSLEEENIDTAAPVKPPRRRTVAKKRVKRKHARPKKK